MSEPTQEELESSIQELCNYRDRLEKEVTSISKKLRMPANKINSVLKSHEELEKINIIIEKLKSFQNYKT